ncbi:MAG: hypothetical protein DMF71_01255 [Acidobacteria bacterium]|nr:MAG: hypothetical protein DMF71_01255 [Acidobacteriota bacterium]
MEEIQRRSNPRPPDGILWSSERETHKVTNLPETSGRGYGEFLASLNRRLERLKRGKGLLLII